MLQPSEVNHLPAESRLASARSILVYSSSQRKCHTKNSNITMEVSRRQIQTQLHAYDMKLIKETKAMIERYCFLRSTFGVL